MTPLSYIYWQWTIHTFLYHLCISICSSLLHLRGVNEGYPVLNTEAFTRVSAGCSSKKNPANKTKLVSLVPYGPSVIATERHLVKIRVMTTKP